MDQLKATGFQQAALYNPARASAAPASSPVLAHGDHPEWYGLPADPRVPLLVKFWKSVLRPLGVVAIFGRRASAPFGHFTKYGRKEVEGTDDDDSNLPTATARRGEHMTTRDDIPDPVDPPSITAQTREDVVVGNEIVRHNRAPRA